MVSVLESESSGPGSSPGRGHCVVVFHWTSGHFTLTVPLFTVKCLRWTGIQCTGSNNTSSNFMLLRGRGDSSGTGTRE